MNNILVKLKTLNIVPNDEGLFFASFTHTTFSNENPQFSSYERLEFLGDSILSKLVSEYIYHNYYNDEGKMSLLKIEAVRGEALAGFSLKEGFDRLVITGKTKEKINHNKKVLEDVFESFVGALFLDQGELAVKKFLKGNLFKYIDEISNTELKSPKTILQELLQGKNRGNISYQTRKNGNYFEAQVIWEGQILGIGKGESKKNAEVAAAQEALSKRGSK